MGRPAGMSNSKMCSKICFRIQVILFYTQETQFTDYLKLSLTHTQPVKHKENSYSYLLAFF